MWKLSSNGLGQAAALSQVAGVVDGPQLLVALPGHEDFVVGVAGRQRDEQSTPLPFGQLLAAAAEQVADAVQRAVGVATVAEGVLLDPPADGVDDVDAELDDVERVKHCGSVG